MANTGAISPGTMADDATVGTAVWVNPDNAKVSDDSFTTPYVDDAPTKDFEVKIVKADDSIGTTNKADIVTSWINTGNIYYSYGASNDLWGESWDDTDINNSNFGVVFSAYNPGLTTSHYLKATNFGFSIPSGATINGILVEVEKHKTGTVSTRPQVDHIRITVFYTEVGGFIPKAMFY